MNFYFEKIQLLLEEMQNKNRINLIFLMSSLWKFQDSKDVKKDPKKDKNARESEEEDDDNEEVRAYKHIKENN